MTTTTAPAPAARLPFGLAVLAVMEPVVETDPSRIRLYAEALRQHTVNAPEAFKARKAARADYLDALAARIEAER